MSDDANKPKKNWIEPAIAILMAIITLITTWCSFESSRWSDLSGDLSTQSNVLDRRSNLLVLQGMQVQSAHLEVFAGFVQAKLSGNEALTKFYTDRIGGELKPAFDAWMAQNPFENPNAPLHPFMPDLYKPRFADEADAARAESTRADDEFADARTIASRYLGMTVMLAAALFFVGTATGFESRRVRLYSLLFGAAILVYVVVRLIGLPVMM